MRELWRTKAVENGSRWCSEPTPAGDWGEEADALVLITLDCLSRVARAVNVCAMDSSPVPAAETPAKPMRRGTEVATDHLTSER